MKSEYQAALAGLEYWLIQLSQIFFLQSLRF